MPGLAQPVAVLAWLIALLPVQFQWFGLVLLGLEWFATGRLRFSGQRLKVGDRIAVLVVTLLPVAASKLGFEVVLPDWFLQSASSFRSQLAAANIGISPDAKSLVLGLTIGDDSQLSKSLVDSMQRLSLTHLTAVSGTNCTIVVIAAVALIGATGLSRMLRVAGAVTALIWYLWLVGPQPSVLRAGLMAIVVLMAQIWGTRFLPRDVLALAVLLALTCWPSLSTSLGFALSVLATLAVLELAPKMANRLSRVLPGWLALSLSVVISAQVACLPLLVWIQSEYSALGIVANLLAEPVVPVITLLGVMGVTVFPLFPWLGQASFWIASLPAAYLSGLAGWLDGLGWNFVALPAALTFGFSLALLALAVTWTMEWKWFRGAGLWLMALVLAMVVGLLTPALQRWRGIATNWSYLSCDVGQGDATLLREGSSVAVVDVGPEARATNQCLRQAGVKDIELLVLTHFDLDHIGGLAGVLGEHRASRVLLPNYQDDRPGAAVAVQILNQYGLTPQLVSLADHGRLGQASWTVLNPPPPGEYLEDANDGSIAMRWDFTGFTALTLADLGEPAQMRLAQNRAQWFGPEFRRKALVLKVSHHGSADEYPELIEWLRPQLATISVGAGNRYGHPTARTLATLNRSGSLTLRTDELGSISVHADTSGSLIWSATGG